MIRKLRIKQPIPLRYFKSDFLERFTHVKLWHIWIVWGPIAISATYLGIYYGGRSGVLLPKILLLTAIMLLAGVLQWTLIEYVLHRFLFHYEGSSSIRKKITWYVHGIHHAQAMLSTRLVMPPVASIIFGLIIALPIWVIFGLIANAGWLGFLFFAGIAYGYLFYDTIHWTVHFYDIDWKWYRNLRRNHMRHHLVSTWRFGVTNTFWDRIFRTHPSEEEEKSYYSRGNKN